MTEAQIIEQLHVAQSRLDASRSGDHLLYLHAWLMSAPTIQVVEIQRMYEAGSQGRTR